MASRTTSIPIYVDHGEGLHLFKDIDHRYTNRRVMSVSALETDMIVVELEKMFEEIGVQKRIRKVNRSRSSKTNKYKYLINGRD